MTKGTALLAVILLYVSLTWYAAQRELWYDELFTYYIAKAPTIATLFDAIKLDLNPPLMYLAARASMAVFGASAYAVRLPAIIGFLIGSLCFYRVVERRLTAAYGLLALMVFWSTPFFNYSTESRPYGLLVCFFGLGMLAYQYAYEPRRPRWSVPLLALAVTGMMSSHFFALFYIVPFGLAEVIRMVRSRKLDLAVWTALLTPCALCLLYLRTVANYGQMAFPPAFQASAVRVLQYFSFSLKPESTALLIAGGLGLIAAPKLRAISTRWWLHLTSVDAAFVAGLLIVPFLISMALMRSHAAFFPRYGIATALAYGVVYTALLAGFAERQRVTATIATCVLALYVVVYNVAETHKTLYAENHQVVEAGLRSMQLDDVLPNLPLVAASGLTFLQMDHYSDDATASRLYYLTGGELALRYAHATIFEGMPQLKKYFPIRANAAPYRQFVAQHPRFLVLGTPDYPEDWLLRCLLDNQAQVRFIGNFLGPYKDSQMFEIVMPGG